MRSVTLLLLGLLYLCACVPGCKDAFDTSNQPNETGQDGSPQDAGQDGGTDTDTGTDTSLSGG
ncbi:MAG: hypothetical protein JRF63_12045 [Deltaproteobacteria bacterium]|nr:hypothetical protein [Deltaproteobacteria bacterium]